MTTPAKAAAAHAALRDELLQAATVLIAWIEQLDFGYADIEHHSLDRPPLFGGPPHSDIDEIFEDILDERRRQAAAFQEPRMLSPGVWLAILGEEVGEAATELLRLNPHLLSEDDVATIIQLRAIEARSRWILADLEEQIG